MGYGKGTWEKNELKRLSIDPQFKCCLPPSGENGPLSQQFVE